MSDKKAPSSGAFLPASLMYFAPANRCIFAAALTAWPVIVGSAVFRAFVDVAKNAEMQVRIFIQNLPLGIYIRSEMLGHECPVCAGFFSKLANALTTSRAGILEKRGPAIGSKLINRIRHGRTFPFLP